MTWRTILAAAVFIGMCGFIAYWGDLLGRRLGKRRLSLFGLRPRYTAIVFTTITGMLIAIFTIAFMATISQRVRLLMLEGEKILRDRDVLVQKYEAARKSADAAKAGAAKAKADARRATMQRDGLIEEVRRISAGLQKLRWNLVRSEAALDRTQRLLTSAQRDLSASNKRLAAAAGEIMERKQEIAAQHLAIRDMEAQRNVLEAEMGEAVAKYQQYIALRQRPVIYRSAEEMARTTVDCAQPKMRIRAEVLRILDEADKAAAKKGARAGENGRAVKIITKRITGPDGTEQRTVTEAASIDALVDEISTGSGSVVLRIVVIGNTVEGEQALVEFVPNYNRLIYWKGQDVAETRIDGSASRGQILGQVISFLRSEVRPAAISKGVIPYFDEEQDQPAVGAISPDQLLDIVDGARNLGKAVRVRAVARADTWSAGPLDLEFRVEVP